MSGADGMSVTICCFTIVLKETVQNREESLNTLFKAVELFVQRDAGKLVPDFRL